MSAPTSYTEVELADLLGLVVGTADAKDYTEAVNETLIAYGVADTSEAKGIVGMRVYSRLPFTGN